VTPSGVEVFLYDHHTMGGAGRGEGGVRVVGEVQRENDSESGSEIQREVEGSCMCVWVCVRVRV